MTHPAAHVDTAPILHELDRISAILNAQVEEERTGRRPDTQVITQACASLAVLAESMRDVEDEVRTWAGELAELTGPVAVLHEHRALVVQSLERALRPDARGNPHEMLHLGRDALFHARCYVEGVGRLESEALQATRSESRMLNRRDFIAG